MRTILITGANRGLGLALATRYASRDDTRVIATARDASGAHELRALATRYAPRVTILEADVADPASIERLARETSAVTASIDVLVNNAGTADWNEFGDVEPARALDILRVNALGPLLVTQALRRYLAADATVANVTSILGSIARATGTNGMAYPMSKAALNMVTKQLAGALRARRIAVLSLHPGWVRTRMGGDDATLSIDESADGMVRVIDGFDLPRSGSFLAYDGTTLPW
ncbi:MAG: SDR family oxidoreductase [Vulcanimicrobiaceae bacterium]